MKARADLLHVAEVLAGEARKTIDGAHEGHAERPARRATQLVHGANAALEAAARVDADPAPLIAAIEDFHRRVNSADVEVSLLVGGPEAALDVIAGLVEHYRQEVAIGAAVQHGYVALRGFLANLVQDFDAADTDTARRIASRIHNALDTADQAVELAKQQGQEQ